MVGFGEILAFDPEQIDDIFRVCSARQHTCDELSGEVRELSELHTWQGDAAKAAKNSAGKTRIDIDAHGHEVWKVAAAARDCYDEGVALKRSAKLCQSDADSKGFVIDPVSGIVADPTPPVMRGWAEADKASYHAEIDALQGRVNDVVAAAERFDDNLAAAINAADGSIPLTPKGETSNVNLADRQANQVAAFRKVFGRQPSTTNDWKTAAAIDPHSYEPKNAGVGPDIRVSRINSLPGKGLVRMNLFIPSEHAYNIPGDNDLGDHRGFDVDATPEQSRVSALIDYDNGLVVVRQNPSVSVRGAVSVAEPKARIAQTDDGSVYLRYNAYNPNVLGGDTGAELSRHEVRESVAVQPTSTGLTFGTNQSNYPQTEVYWDPPDGPTQTVYQNVPSNAGSTGALQLLPLTHDGGDQSVLDQFEHARPSVGYPGSGASQPYVAETTKLGTLEDIPRATIVRPSR